MSMAQQTIMVEGRPYVLLPRAEYERLTALAKTAELPALPAPDADGNYPAVEYARVSLARKIITSRVAAGITQRELARRSGISFEHLSRIESGKHVPSLPTIDKIDRALKQSQRRTTKRTVRKAGQARRK
jgi:DNA-binding XRE family transcriptional regulator